MSEHGRESTAQGRREPRYPLVLALAVSLALVGCGGGSNDNLAGGDSTDPAESRSSVVQNTVPATTPTTIATTTTAARRQVEVVKSGFSQLAPNSIGTSYVSYAAIVRNPNPDTWIAAGVNINFTFTNSAGTVVKSESESFTAILPGETVAIGDSTQAESAMKVDVKALVNRWENVAPGNLGGFTAEGVTTSTQRFGGMKTNATVRSAFVRDIKNPKAVAVYYDSSGSIIGGAFTFVDFVPGGGTVGVEITSLTSIPNVANTEVYVHLTNLSLMPP